MVLAMHRNSHHKKRFQSLGDRKKEVYHRLDLKGNDKTKYCKLFDEILTKGKTADMKLLLYFIAFFSHSTQSLLLLPLISNFLNN